MVGRRTEEGAAEWRGEASEMPSSAGADLSLVPSAASSLSVSGSTLLSAGGILKVP